jgi:hypothetical protein
MEPSIASRLRKNFDTLVEKIDENFNVFSDEGEEIPDGLRLTMMVIGLNLFTGNLLPGGEKGSSLFKRAVPLAGMSLMIGGLSGKRGYLYTPAVIALMYPLYIAGKQPAGDFYRWWTKDLTVVNTKSA